MHKSEKEKKTQTVTWMKPKTKFLIGPTEKPLVHLLLPYKDNPIFVPSDLINYCDLNPSPNLIH